MQPTDEALRGLSEAEASARLARDGLNRLPPPQHKTLATALLALGSQPMVLLLLASTLLYALLGSAFDSVVLALSLVAVAAISVYQELRTQRLLEALRDLSSPRSTVVRGGVVQRIASQELVAGDRLIVQEGDRLACDAQLVEAHAMRVDESLLSGESVPVDKRAADTDGADSALRAGTLVVQGDGAATVMATGARTTLGHIGGSLALLPQRTSRLHEELKRLVRGVAVVALLTCLFAAAVFGWRAGSWAAGMLVGLTLAMAIVPEEFAVVWTVMLALGAWRLAQFKVLTRQPQAIEALGAATVLCVDKTGTLTCNRMEVVALHDGDAAWQRGDGRPPPHWDRLLRIAGLASVRSGLEPMDKAIFCLLPAPDGPVTAALQGRSGVMPDRPFVVQAWRFAHEATTQLAIKGAPEAVLLRCAGDPVRLQRLAAQAEQWARCGLRVLAVAHARCDASAEPPEAGHEAIGLVAFEDPLRDDVPDALRACRDAGLRVVMITGDAPATALAIARDAGLVAADADASAVLTGAQLDALDAAQLAEAVVRTAVFARVAPAHKVRIVQALQRRGEVVAMTGDGVNDGPALRAADIGVAMGERGTDVAREAAGIVLLDDRFGALVDGVRAGRRIFINLRKALGYLFAVHVPIVGLALLPLFGGPTLLLPIHVVLLELIIDPACSLVFEAEPLPPDGMKRPPHAADTRLFDTAAIARALTVGGIAFGVVALVQWLAWRLDLSADAMRLAGLVGLVAGNLVMLQWFRGGFGRAVHTNTRFFALVLGVCLLGAAILLLAPVAAAFGLPAALAPWWVAAGLAAPTSWAVLRLLRRDPAAAGG